MNEYEYEYEYENWIPLFGPKYSNNSNLNLNNSFQHWFMESHQKQDQVIKDVSECKKF